MRLLVTGFALIALALASTARAQEAPTPSPAIGMVDQPCAPGSSGRSPGMAAFARAMVQDGAMDMSVMKTYAKDLADSAKADEVRAKTDWADLCRYRDANATLGQGGAEVVFLGDSITELWRVADPTLFSHGVVNRGISGQTSPQILLRFYADVVALHPRVVHIMIGTNDLAGNTGPSRVEDFKNNIRAMVDIAKAHQIAVILASIPPASTFSWRREVHPAAEIKALNAWLADFALHQDLTYADYYRVLAGPDGGMKPGLSRDGVHPLVSGYVLMRSTAEGGINRAMVIAKR